MSAQERRLKALFLRFLERLGLSEYLFICLEGLKWPRPLARLSNKGDMDRTCAFRTHMRHVVVVVVVAKGAVTLSRCYATAKGQEGLDDAKTRSIGFSFSRLKSSHERQERRDTHVSDNTRKKKKASVSIHIISLSSMTKSLNRTPPISLQELG